MDTGVELEAHVALTRLINQTDLPAPARHRYSVFSGSSGTLVLRDGDQQSKVAIASYEAPGRAHRTRNDLAFLDLVLERSRKAAASSGRTLSTTRAHTSERSIIGSVATARLLDPKAIFSITMVCIPSASLLIVALTAIQLQPAAAASLQLDPSTNSCRLESAFSSNFATLEKYFGSAMERKLKNLPTTALHSPSPWPGPAWPTFQDSINFEWNQGQPSAAEKYANAFGLNVANFTDSVSAQNGIYSLNTYPKCTSDKECADSDAVCAKRANATTGYCIPTWFAMDHAWISAATFESEPTCPVTFNGVTFQPLDIKALITEVYDGVYNDLPYAFAGSRYNGNNDSIDAFGHHTDYSYRDLNPGFFHVVATNLLGLLNRTFVIDRAAGYGVWNQPVVGFKVYEQTIVSTEKAANTFYGLKAYPWNENATSIVYVKSRLSWVEQSEMNVGIIASGLMANFTGGAYYDYLLEIDEHEEIIGGGWLYGSNDNHPDFLWFITAKPPAETVTSYGLSYANVTMLLEKSTSCSGTDSA
ncbi:hypothetical protein ON010_g14273 [Phytophthora cinnamomi]|nr:hypothetical protein ON010_g14273 [Phytophthora cinnamomi]